MPSPGQEKFVLPRSVSEFSGKVDINLSSQLLGSSFGEDKETFRDRYLTYIQFSNIHKITASQINEIFRSFLKNNMKILSMELESGINIVEKLR